MMEWQQVAYVDASATALGLSIGPWHTGVLRYFALATEMYAVVEAYPVGTHDESAETFTPVAPPST
jgi:hypothetical protein